MVFQRKHEQQRGTNLDFSIQSPNLVLSIEFQTQQYYNENDETANCVA